MSRTTCVCGAVLDDEAVDACAKCGARLPPRDPSAPQSRQAVGFNVFLRCAFALFFSWVTVLIGVGLKAPPRPDAVSLLIAALIAAGAGYFWWTAYLTAVRKRRAVATGGLSTALLLFTLAWAIAYQQFSRVYQLSRDADTKASLGVMRASLEDTKTLGKPGRARLREHSASGAVLAGSAPDDAGGWLYDETAGKVWVNCTHTDSKGVLWSAY